MQPNPQHQGDGLPGDSVWREESFSAGSSEARVAALRPHVASKRIAVGVCAGIASYKVCSVVSALAQAGAEVTVALTPDAQRFVTPLVFQSLSGRAVLTSVWESSAPADPQHIRIASALDLYLIAPARWTWPRSSRPVAATTSCRFSLRRSIARGRQLRSRRA